MKKILYIHQYFKTPEEGGALRSYHIAKKLSERGNMVEIITAHNNPGYEKRLIDGFTVHYLPVFYTNHLDTVRRYKAFLKFSLQAVRLSGKLSRPDLVFATSTPLTVGLIALWLKFSKKIPFIFEVRDLWPEAPIQLGIIRSPILKYLLKKTEKAVYQHALCTVALSPGIADGVRQRYPKAKISMIPNMSDLDFFEESPGYTDELNDFIIGYFGTFGKANHLEYILDLAQACTEAGLPVQFRLYGEGTRKKYLEEQTLRSNLNNIRIFSYQNRYDLRNSMRNVDANITVFLNLPVLETNSPNKFFDGLAAKKLSIVNTRGWLKDLAEHHNCGLYADPDHPERFPELIRPFIRDRRLLRQYQLNGRRLAEDRFSKEKLTKQICEIIEQAG